MTAPDLMERLTRRGVRLSVRNHRLVIDAPKGALTAADRAELQANKPALLEILTSVDPPAEPTSSCGDPAKPAMLPPPPPEFAVPRRTSWGTVVASAPDAPPIELFGPPPHWPVLAAGRWGPAADDPIPGVIIDRPDHDWMRATSDAATRADPYAAAEREVIRAEPPDTDLSSLRAIIAGWSIPWRERWGRRANELAEQGIRFPEDERRAFVEVLAEIEAGAEPPPIDVTPPVEPSAPVRWRCTNRFCRDGSRWWASVWGVINCAHCRPPSFPGLVVAQGDEADAPPCERSRSNQSIRSPDDLGSLRQVQGIDLSPASRQH